MHATIFKKRHFSKHLLLLAAAAIICVPAFAEGPKPPSSMSNPFVTLMVIIIALLAIVIAIMARVVIATAVIYYDKQKKDLEPRKASIAPQAAAVLALLLCSINVFAQSKPDAPAATTIVNGISDTAYYLLVSVVFVELLLIGALLYMLRVFTGLQKAKAAKAAGLDNERPAANGFKKLWDKLNNFKPLNEEADIDLGHNYDGIKELDNRLPPWWLYGFYCTIIFACIYLYMHHISHSAPNPIEEYQAAVVQADIAKEAYLKKSANNVDETTVKLLTDDASLTAGKTIFQSTCFACHGKAGEGGVGPNLTDDYWLHGGTIQDVFKTIKYGWADKGMKSWKDDFSPMQIAQIASYVKSLHGTNPPNAKPPQGTLSTDGAAAAKDSTAAKDTSNVTKKI